MLGSQKREEEGKRGNKDMGQGCAFSVAGWPMVQQAVVTGPGRRKSLTLL